MTELLWDELLWRRRQPPSRGPKPALTLTAIARAAIGIADAEGLDAVSMQRVAGELAFTKMALYRYVPGKAELIAVMTDLAISPPPEHPQRNWRQGLEAWALALFEVFERHPWLLVSTVGRRIVGPNELAWLDRCVQLLTDTGLNGGEQLDTAVVLAGHVRTIAQQTLKIPGGTGGASEADITNQLVEVLTNQPDRFPGLAAALRSVEGHQNQGLTYGLNRILDGVESLIATR